MDIIVNGPPKTLTTTSVSYADIVILAGCPFRPYYSITYRRGATENREGILAYGQTVEVVAGMVFNLAYTGDA